MVDYPQHPEYASSWYCAHDGALRMLSNGEMACERCIHVAVRADGTLVNYKRPPWFDDKKPAEPEKGEGDGQAE